jgi:predicted RNA-binding Zn-ribbon protein involved in translation (DUF1610 family)
MGDPKAHRAGSRFFRHCAFCAGAFLAVVAAAGALAFWSPLGVGFGVAFGVVGALGCGAYAWFLLYRFRVECPQCGEKTARLARDTLNRQILDCPACGYRAATGFKVLADSPFGH